MDGVGVLLTLAILACIAALIVLELRRRQQDQEEEEMEETSDSGAAGHMVSEKKKGLEPTLNSKADRPKSEEEIQLIYRHVPRDGWKRCPGCDCEVPWGQSRCHVCGESVI